MRLQRGRVLSKQGYMASS